MDTKIMWVGAFVLLGWLWSYFFVRQILFNIFTALPLTKKMEALQEDLIGLGARRYTTISFITCGLVAAVLLFVVIYFCKLYQIISFAVGAVVAIVMLFNFVQPTNRNMFDSFCSAYYRFVPDDELRTAMYNRDLSRIKARLKDMGLTDTFVPKFKK